VEMLGGSTDRKHGASSKQNTDRVGYEPSMRKMPWHLEAIKVDELVRGWVSYGRTSRG